MPRPSDAIPELPAGTAVGQYRLIEQLSGGGLARAYLAEHSFSAQKVCIIHSHWGASTRERFSRWIDILARLNHTNLVPLLDCGEHEGFPYAVLRYVDGKSLRELVEEGQLQDLLTVLRLFRTIAGAVAYCHEQGIAHRNLRHLSVLIDREGTPFLTDFAIATDLHGDPVEATSQLRTPLSLAPESWEYLDKVDGDWTPCDHTLAVGDVWSMGVLLFYSLSTKFPYHPVQENPLAIQEVICSAEPVDLSPLSELPTPVVELIGRCLEKDHRRRYQDGRELETALTALIDHLEVGTEQLPEHGPIVGQSLLLFLTSGTVEWEGRYIQLRVCDTIGSGSFADVFRVEVLHGPMETKGDGTEPKELALKVLKQGVLETESAQARFVREAKFLAQVKHENVVGIEGFGPFGQSYFILMELLRGQTLGRVMATQRFLPVWMAARFATQIARGLQAIHDAGLVHRDLKPENIVVTDSDRIVIADFGMAHSHDSSRLTATGAFCGTPAYASPQQIAGQEPGPSNDLYSLGVVLYELISGHRPHEADSTAALLHAILREPPAPLSSHRPDLSSRAVDLVMRSVDPLPEQRYRNASDLLQALDELSREGDDFGQRSTLELPPDHPMN